MKNVGKNQEKQLKREEKRDLKEEQKARQNEQPQIKDVSDFYGSASRKRYSNLWAY